MTRNRSFKIFVFLSITLLLIGSFFAFVLGAKNITPATIWDAIVHYEPILDHQLIRDVRLPRILCTIFVGGLLGVCGAMMQGVTRNPIAEPSILGISQGATLAISVLYFNTAWLSAGNILLASFCGALLSGLCIILFASRGPSNLSMSKLLLAGTALSTFFLSLSSLIGIITNNSQMIAFLVGGGFRTATWDNVLLLVITTMIAMILVMLLSSKINIVALGDDVCIGLGENPNRIRLYALLLIVPLSAVCVAVAKNIVFVGLIIPQVVKRIVKHDYRFIIPASFLAGAVLLVFSDIFARVLQSPYETPIGIFTSLIGIPFFLYLIKKERG